ncbi:MAG: galactose mutarotase [Steroidobacteraceae bacterium]
MTASPDDIGPLIRLNDPRSAATAVIAPERGAIVTSFSIGGRELLYMDTETLRNQSKNVRGGIPILFPSPGKLERDQWQIGKKTGSMKQHGFARNLPWAIGNRSAQTATLLLESSDVTLAQFPWPFRAELEIGVQDACLRLVTRISNTGQERMPYALGFHPYFHVTDKAGARISSRATRALDNVLKAVVPFSGFDLTRSEVDLHLLDHPDTHATLQLADGAKITVRATADFVRWVVWTVQDRDFVCVEPWTAPGNALNTGEHLIELPPGDTHESRMEIELEGGHD